MSQPSDSVHVLSFTSRARVAAAQSVTLENPTEKSWFITPVLKGEHWQGAGQLQVRLMHAMPLLMAIIRVTSIKVSLHKPQRLPRVGNGDNLPYLWSHQPPATSTSAPHTPANWYL